MNNIEQENVQQSNDMPVVETSKRGRKAKVADPKVEKKIKPERKSKKQLAATHEEEDVKKAVDSALGDVVEKIYKACDSRKLSINSKRSAVSMATKMFKKYGRLMTPEEVESDSPNAKARGNNRWLLKLINSK